MNQSQTPASYENVDFTNLIDRLLEQLGFEKLSELVHTHPRRTLYATMEWLLPNFRQYTPEMFFVYKKLVALLTETVEIDMWIPKTINEFEILYRFFNRSFAYGDINGRVIYEKLAKNIIHAIAHSTVRLCGQVEGCSTQLYVYYSAFPNLFESLDSEIFAYKLPTDKNTAFWHKNLRLNTLIALNRACSLDIICELDKLGDYEACAANARNFYSDDDTLWIDTFLVFLKKEREAYNLVCSLYDFAQTAHLNSEDLLQNGLRNTNLGTLPMTSQHTLRNLLRGELYRIRDENKKPLTDRWNNLRGLPNRMTAELHGHAIVLIQSGLPLLCIMHILLYAHKFLFVAFGEQKLTALVTRTITKRMQLQNPSSPTFTFKRLKNSL